MKRLSNYLIADRKPLDAVERSQNYLAAVVSDNRLYSRRLTQFAAGRLKTFEPQDFPGGIFA
jgi:hypothetical protein